MDKFKQKTQLSGRWIFWYIKDFKPMTVCLIDKTTAQSDI